MNTLRTKYHLNMYKLLLLCGALLFSAGAAVVAAGKDKPADVLLSLVTALLLLAPTVFGRILHFTMNSVVFTILIIYALGPCLGSLYKLYYLTPWWDDWLHFCGGVVFAAVGYLLLDILSKEGNTRLTALLFALCFSISVSVVWEFYEFGCDCFFGSDMQTDTVVNRIVSYRLANVPGIRGSIEAIRDTTVNGTSLGVEGYLDLGLRDTMKDLLLEAGGAVLFCLYSWIDKNRHPLFKRTI